MDAGFQTMARLLIICGALLLGAGVLLWFGPKVPWVGRLPGDIMIQREHFTFYFPLASCLLVSLLCSLVWWLIRRFR